MDLIDKRDEALRIFLEHGIMENAENNVTKADLAECAEAIVKNLSIPVVSGSAFLYDALLKKPVKMWYVDEQGNYYIDTNPHGVDMSGKRRILPADKDRYKVHYH